MPQPRQCPARILLVNADDLGRTAGINAGIFAAHAEGIVTSATLMVTFPAAAEAAAAWARHPRLGIGLHLTLTGSRPLLPPERVPSLVDAEGRFPRRPEGLGGAAQAEVLAEARAQLGLFRELAGRLPTHLDSHHHAHRLPPVREALITLAREFRLPVRKASPEVGRRLAEAGVPTTDTFLEAFFGEGARLDVLLDLVTRLGPGTSELMCHPGLADEELRRESTYADERERELTLLTAPAVGRAVADHGIRLAHFGDLASLVQSPSP